MNTGGPFQWGPSILPAHMQRIAQNMTARILHGTPPDVEPMLEAEPDVPDLCPECGAYWHCEHAAGGLSILEERGGYWHVAPDGARTWFAGPQPEPPVNPPAPWAPPPPPTSQDVLLDRMREERRRLEEQVAITFRVDVDDVRRSLEQVTSAFQNVAQAVAPLREALEKLGKGFAAAIEVVASASAHTPSAPPARRRLAVKVTSVIDRLDDARPDDIAGRARGPPRGGRIKRRDGLVFRRRYRLAYGIVGE